MLRIEYAYWLIAAFLLYTGLRNLRERHVWHAAFWLVLGALFGAGDLVLRQQAAGHPLPARLAGVGVIVLDTHTLVWWATGDPQLPARVRKLIDREAALPGRQVLMSAISAWEIAMLVERGRIALALDLDEWLQAVESLDGLAMVSVTAQVAVQSATLPGEFHKDHADRMIVALARERNAVLVSADEKIQRYPHVRWSW